jgi:cyanophycinase
MFRKIILRLACLFIASALGAQTPTGTLVIAGGGKLPPVIFQAFVEASGGKGARIAVLPAASGVPKEAAQSMVVEFERLGAVVVVVDPKHRAEAEAAGQWDTVKRCTGFWFTGGDQNRIVDKVGGTALHGLILQRYREGAAVGGTSAGAAMMSRIMLVGTDDVSETAPGTYKTRPGLGFLPGCIVDQHFLRRSRHNRLLSLVMEHPDHLALGIDEETAILVKHGVAQVIGNRRVLVLDPSSLAGASGTFTDLRVHLLGPGQSLDLASRKPTALSASGPIPVP